jgi:hypothetical protein
VRVGATALVYYSDIEMVKSRAVHACASDSPERNIFNEKGDGPMTRRDWWLGVAAIVAALILHAAIPRHEITRWTDDTILRADRWTGRVEMISVRAPDSLRYASWLGIPRESLFTRFWNWAFKSEPGPPARRVISTDPTAGTPLEPAR